MFKRLSWTKDQPQVLNISSYLSHHHYTSEQNALHSHQLLDLCSHGIHSHCQQLQQGFILLRVSTSWNRSVDVISWSESSEHPLINKLSSGDYHSRIVEALRKSAPSLNRNWVNNSRFYCLDNENNSGDIVYNRFCANGCQNGSCK